MSWIDTEKNQLRRENTRLRAELEAAKKVADAAIAYYEYDYSGGIKRHFELSQALTVAVREYRVSIEPLSPGKRAAIEKGLDGLEDEEALENICNCGAGSQ